MSNEDTPSLHVRHLTPSRGNPSLSDATIKTPLLTLDPANLLNTALQASPPGLTRNLLLFVAFTLALVAGSSTVQSIWKAPELVAALQALQEKDHADIAVLKAAVGALEQNGKLAEERINKEFSTINRQFEKLDAKLDKALYSTGKP